MQSNTTMDSPKGAPGGLLTSEEVARHLKVSKKTIYRLVEARHLPHYRLRGALRFAPSDLDRYLSELRVSSEQSPYGRL